MYYYEVDNIKGIIKLNNYREARNRLHSFHPNNNIVLVKIPSNTKIIKDIVINGVYKSYNRSLNTLLRVRVKSVDKYVSMEILKHTTGFKNIDVINLPVNYFKQFFELYKIDI